MGGCVCGSTSRVLGVWVIQFSVTLFRKISRDPTEQSSSESSLNFPDPNENRTSGSRFDAQPIVEASYAGPAPLDLGAPAPRLVGIVSTEVASDPHTPGDFLYIISMVEISCMCEYVEDPHPRSYGVWGCGVVDVGVRVVGGWFTHSRRRPPYPERNH